MKFNDSNQDIHLGPTVNVLDLNVEGISLAKSAVISKIATDNDIHVILLQETHAKSHTDLLKRCSIVEFSIAANIPHKQYGIATLVRNDISDVKLSHKSCENDVELLGVDVNGLNIVNIYKPPSRNWSKEVMPIFNEATAYIGDCNSHHSGWGYSHSNEDGNKLSEWIALNNYNLIINLKDRKSFRSAAHQTETNPDLCIFNNRDDEFLSAKRKVLPDFPHSQHRPIILTFESKIYKISSMKLPRWNFGKADWKLYEQTLDDKIKSIEAKSSNYDSFCEAVISAAKTSIPRGYRKKYIPG